MKILSYIASSLFFMWSVNYSDLQTCREHYIKASMDKSMCEKMIKYLEGEKNKLPIYLGYLGGYQTIWATHVFNPITKLNTFNKGRRNIEQDIQKEPNNVELRFIRLSVQKNAPAFLDYHSNIKIDKEFILKNRNQILSESMNSSIELLLKD